MKINVFKASVETALAPILKMLSSTKLPADFHPTLTFKADAKRVVWLGCTLPDSLLELVLPDAACNAKDASFHVNLEMFRKLIEPAGTNVSIDQQDSHVQISVDGRITGSLVPMPGKDASAFQLPKDIDSTVLPTNFSTFLQQAFGCVSTAKDRPALAGVNVSSRGIAATDGKQLFHLPLPLLQLKKGVTLPPSKSYSHLKALRWSNLAHWRNADNSWMFAISGEAFRYVGKAIDAQYPSYWQIIPASSNGDLTVTLTDDGVAERLLAFLNERKGDCFADLTVYPDRFELTDGFDLKKAECQRHLRERIKALWKENPGYRNVCIVLDNYASIMGRNQESEAAIPLMNFCKEFQRQGLVVVLACHTNQKGEIAGSAYLRRRTNGVIRLSKVAPWQRDIMERLDAAAEKTREKSPVEECLGKLEKEFDEEERSRNNVKLHVSFESFRSQASPSPLEIVIDTEEKCLFEETVTKETKMQFAREYANCKKTSKEDVPHSTPSQGQTPPNVIPFSEIKKMPTVEEQIAALRKIVNAIKCKNRTELAGVLCVKTEDLDNFMKNRIRNEDIGLSSSRGRPQKG